MAPSNSQLHDTATSLVALLVVSLLALVAGMSPATARVELAGEQCNGRDDNLDGLHDERLACGCQEIDGPYGAHLLCRTSVGWHEAARACDAMNMRLASIDSAREDRWLQFETWWIADGPRWWIGLNDLVSEGQPTWTDGAAPAYEAWGFGQPNDWQGGDCVTLWRSGAGWYDAACDERKGFVCEAAPSPSVASGRVPRTDEGSSRLDASLSPPR